MKIRINNLQEHLKLYNYKNYIIIARCGIRTHETAVRDLKSRPFDRSGILALEDYLPRDL